MQLKNSDVRGEVFETGALAGRLAAYPPQNPVADEWHELEVRVIGQHYRVMVDGAVLINVQAADQVMPQHLWPVSGVIGLQGASATAPSVEFKEVRIHPLP